MPRVSGQDNYINKFKYLSPKFGVYNLMNAEPCMLSEKTIVAKRRGCGDTRKSQVGCDFDCPLFPWMVHGTQLHDFD